MSQCDRIAAVLADGQPHRMTDIHRVVGFCRLNSRIAELRTRGHVIVCERKGADYIYTELVHPGAVADEGAADGNQRVPATDPLPLVERTGVTDTGDKTESGREPGLEAFGLDPGALNEVTIPLPEIIPGQLVLEVAA